MNHVQETTTALALVGALTTGQTAPYVDALRQADGAHSETQTSREFTDEMQARLGEIAAEDAMKQGDPSLISSIPSADGKMLTNTRVVSVERPWAFEFSNSPEAHAKPDSEDMQEFTGALDAIKANNETLNPEETTAKGFASDEADTFNAKGELTPGLGVANPENVTLAEDRSRAVSTVAKAAIKGILGRDVEPKIEKGEEVIDPVFAQKEAELAAQLHMTPIELAAKYNHGAELPKDVKDQLDRWIHDRRVDLKLVSQKEVPSSPHTTEQTDTGKDRVIPPIPVVITPSRNGGERVISASDKAENTALPPENIAFLPKLRSETVGIKGGQTMSVNTQAAYARIQPRNYNMSKNPNMGSASKMRGKQSRSHGGNLSRLS